MQLLQLLLLLSMIRDLHIAVAVVAVAVVSRAMIIVLLVTTICEHSIIPCMQLGVYNLSTAIPIALSVGTHDTRQAFFEEYIFINFNIDRCCHVTCRMMKIESDQEETMILCDGELKLSLIHI